MNESRIQRGLVRSVMLAPLAAASGIGLALILIGVLAREGGLELVGQWAMLQAYVAIALTFDLGLTFGVNRRVATEDAAEGFALVARAAIWPLGLAALCGAAAAWSAAMGATGWIFGAAVALAAGAVQLLTQWCAAIQTGAHRHVYTQGAMMFLNLAQFTLVLSVLWGLEHPAAPMLALAILLARVLHLLLVLALLWFSPLGFRAWAAAPRRAPWRAVLATASGFTLFAVALKGRIPLLRLSIGFLGGDAALGVFAIAQRAPEAISRVFSSGLQTMLAGFAGMAPGEESARFVRRGLEVQVAFCLPLFIAFIAHTPAILDLWIGAVDADLVAMTRMMCLAGIVGGLTMPFFWALQAAGAANFMAAILAAQTLLIIAIGFIGFRLAGTDAFVFVAAFALLSAATDIIYAVRALRTVFGVGIIRDWFRTRRIWLVIAANIAAAGLSAFGAEGAGIVELAARIAAYAAVSAGISFAMLR